MGGLDKGFGLKSQFDHSQNIPPRNLFGHKVLCNARGYFFGKEIFSVALVTTISPGHQPPVDHRPGVEDCGRTQGWRFGQWFSQGAIITARLYDPLGGGEGELGVELCWPGESTPLTTMRLFVGMSGGFFGGGVFIYYPNLFLV